jgi:putative ABC transport system permease protein
MNTYFKLAWRNLWKQKAFTALNIFGLTVAFATAILLGLAALFDLSFDTFHENKKDLYQVYKSNQKAEGTVIATASSIPFTPALKAEVAGIKHITRYAGNTINIKYNEKELVLGANLVDADYLKMFTIPIVKGNTAPLNTLLVRFCSLKWTMDGSLLRWLLFQRICPMLQPFSLICS